MTTTSTYDYDSDLAAAEALYDTQESRDGYPAGEYEKTRADRLNNAWSEGITVEQWVARALGRE